VTPTYDVAVLGCGAVGSACAYALARRGARVLALDRFDIPNALGSSHGDSRMIRLAYYEHPDYVPLARRAWVLWRELEESSGERLLWQTGGLYMGPADGPLVRESHRAAREHQLAVELLDHGALVRRFPHFRLPPGYAGLYEEQAGVLLSEAAIAAFVHGALAGGAVVHGREAVRELSVEASGVAVITDHGTYRVGRAVVAAGPWAGKLLPVLDELGATLTVTRQVIGWVWPQRPELFALERHPVWAIEGEPGGPGGLYYGIPLLGNRSPRPGMKLGHHWHDRAVDPDDLDRRPRPGDEDDFLPALRRLAPAACGPLLSQAVCLYTVSPDSHFVVDLLPGTAGRVAFAAGLSGHGFKFAPVLGEALADLVLEGASPLPIGFLGLGRLAPADG
jgi:sarcosine oxidase